jgi:hypothetical protein
MTGACAGDKARNKQLEFQFAKLFVNKIKYWKALQRYFVGLVKISL